MSEQVKTRRYRSARREAQAAATRHAVLLAARDLLTSRGYSVTVAEIADQAGVAVDTVYASVGRKPALVLAVIDMVLAGADEPLPAEQRDYVQRVRGARSARDKLAVYAEALATLVPRIAPLQEALRRAGEDDPECARAWQQLVDRRAANMLAFAEDLRATGGLREDLADRDVADLVWTTNSAEYYLLLRQRGWTPDRYRDHLLDLWCRLLLRPAG